MKKLYLPNLILIILTVLCYSCAKDKVDYAIISGKVVNGKELKLMAYSGTGNVDKVITLKENSTFRDTVYTEEGLYNIFDGKNMIGFYIKPSKEYVINYDVNSFREKGIQLLGSDTVYNKYFTKKSQKRVFIDPTSKTNEKEIRVYLNQIKKEQLDRLYSAELSEQLEAYERHQINYTYLADMMLFLSYANIKEPSETTIQELSINYNNEELYRTVGSYRRLIDYYYSKLMSDYEREKRTVDTSYTINQDALRFYASSIPNEYIKNQIIANNALYYFKNAKDLKNYYEDFKTYYNGNDSIFIKNMLDSYSSLTKIETNSPSPKFFNYKNYEGGANSLDDFSGKYVFINLWATWCGPCISNIPALQNLIKEYEDKNIVFLSIAWKDNEVKWRKTIKEKKLSGIQLFADYKNESFFEEYGVYGIPRYILIDQKGKIIDYTAPSPTDPELKIILNNLLN